jgi:hypothetical protein
MAFNQFDVWKAGLQNAMNSLSGTTAAKASFKAKEKAKPETDFEKLLTKFAVEFMQHFFVEEVFKPAFFDGRGIGGSGASSVSQFTPQIALGYSEIQKRVTYQKEKGHIDAADAMGSMTAEQRDAYYKRLEKQQQRERATAGATSKRESNINRITEAAGAEGASISASWETGFGQLFSAMTKMAPARVGGSSIRVDMGPGSGILAQKLGAYSVSQGVATRGDGFDSFFYAAEFGTGIASNVGGAQWIREIKHNNAQNGPFKGPPGSWWFGDQEHGGGLWSGQKGIHFLFDQSTRQPLPIYRDWIAKNLRPKFAQFMAANTKGRVQQV